jgi:hypothetical protein
MKATAKILLTSNIQAFVWQNPLQENERTTGFPD